MNRFLELSNGECARLAELPRTGGTEFRRTLLEELDGGSVRLESFFALPEKKDGTFLLTAVLLDPEKQKLKFLSAETGSEYPSLTVENPVFHWFEREIFEQYGIRPEGHPRLKPLRFQTAPDGTRPLPGDTDYFLLHGTAAHEVAVGPVHAGVIEPGHFRFQCMGEDVYALEIELGYQHRGIEKLLEGKPGTRTLHFAETASGDASVAEALCACAVAEGMGGGLEVSPRARALRTVALELERIANHTGDLGALAGDVAFLPTAAYCGRIRGDFLNRTAALCGNRFGRGFVVPGGVRYDLEDSRAKELAEGIVRSGKELENALNLLFEEPSVLDRFENTGTVTRGQAEEIGMVGVAARASGVGIDARKDLPGFLAPDPDFVPEVGKSGDVFARADVRRAELFHSIARVREILSNLPGGDSVPERNGIPELAPDSICAAVTEAWRGELCHTVLTDSEGKIRRAKIVDPSFRNWFGLELALRGEQISDFPICNKSFNLSYCGHDL